MKNKTRISKQNPMSTFLLRRFLMPPKYLYYCCCFCCCCRMFIKNVSLEYKFCTRYFFSDKAPKTYIVSRFVIFTLSIVFHLHGVSTLTLRVHAKFHVLAHTFYELLPNSEFYTAAILVLVCQLKIACFFSRPIIPQNFRLND